MSNISSHAKSLAKLKLKSVVCWTKTKNTLDGRCTANAIQYLKGVAKVLQLIIVLCHMPKPTIIPF